MSSSLPPAWRFAPPPRNDFLEFSQTYFDRCRERVPRIEGSAGKWLFEDLIPGLSDFDTRFFVNDAMTSADWCHMSMEVGRVHLELARERKDWARNLEHLPGVNLKWDELLDPALYFSELSQWSFYHGPAPMLAKARHHAASHSWVTADELYHWKKIATYVGPYNRSIDPPINLGEFENKYSLHSRLLHYFAPPVHSAVCLSNRRSSPGKIEALRQARQLFPNPGLIDLAMSAIDRHYEMPHFLTEPGMTELDRAMEDYLAQMVDVLLPNSPLDCPSRPTPAQLKRAVAEAEGPVSYARLFENIKFARLMKGRLWFYAQEVPWFESGYLIRNELNRIYSSFYEGPLRLFAALSFGRTLSADEALALMARDVFDRDQVAACRKFASLARDACPDADLRARALAIAAIFDPFLSALECLMKVARERLRPPG